MVHRFIFAVSLVVGCVVIVVPMIYGIKGSGLFAQGFSTKNSVRALAVSPDGSLLAGTFGNGIYRSRDQGAHWKKISEGLEDPYILTIAAVTRDLIFAGTARKGVFRTRDGGNQWNEVNSGLGKTEVKALLFKQKTLFAGTGDGVFSSPNDGEKWEAYNVGLERILVRSLVMDAKGNLFAGTSGKGLFIRKPNTLSWNQVTKGFKRNIGILENFIRTLTVNPDGTLYAGTFDGGVYISIDGGTQWTWWSAGMTNQSIRELLVGSDGTLYIGTGKGIFARAPGDEEWRSISDELDDDSVQSMALDASGMIYVGTTQGLYKGTIKGKWEMISPGFSRLNGKRGDSGSITSRQERL